MLCLTRKVFILDAHNHIGLDVPPIPPLVPPQPDFGQFRTVEELIDQLDRNGVSMAIVQQDVQHTTTLFLTKQGHEYLAKAVKKHPDRLIGMCLAHPLIDDSVKEARRRLSTSEFRAIKIWPMADYPINSEIIYPLMNLCEEYDASIRIHCEIDDPRVNPWVVGELAKEYPKVPIIMAHMPNEMTLRSSASVEICKRYRNVYAETGGLSRSSEIGNLIEKAGDGKVVFGTDNPWFSMEVEIAKIELLDIPEKSKNKVLGLNMAGILGMEVC